MLVGACSVSSEEDVSDETVAFDGMTGAQADAARALPKLRRLEVDAQGLPKYLEADLGVLRTDAAVRDGDLAALRGKLAPLLRMRDSVQLAVRRSASDANGSHVRLAQTIHGLEVVDGEIVVHTDTRSGAIRSVQAWHLPDETLPTMPAIGADQIFAAAALGKDVQLASKPTLAYLRTHDGRGVLGWQFEIAGAAPVEPDPSCPTVPPGPPPTTGIIFVDGNTGEVLRRHSYEQPLYRIVFDLPLFDKCSANTPVEIMHEGQTPPTTMAADAYNNSGATHRYLLGTFNWKSWNGDDAGMFTVLDSNDKTGSYWKSDNMVYLGKGNNTQFGPFAHALDIVGHEFGHGVVQSLPGLVYQGESGALNESYADVFGVGVEVRERGLNPADPNTWKIGEDAYTPRTAGDALRYMNDPAKDAGQFSYTSIDYWPLRVTDPNVDSGGVHFNSGISNLAFYLMSQGGVHPRRNTGVTVPAIGFGAAQQVYFAALSHLPSNATFVDMRRETASAAFTLGGVTQRDAVCKAWDAVGVPASAPCLNGPPPVADLPPMPTGVSVTWASCRGQNVVRWNGSGATFRIWSYASATAPTGIKVFEGAVTATSSGYEKQINSGDGAVIRVQACNSTGCGNISTSSGTAHYEPGCR